MILSGSLSAQAPQKEYSNWILYDNISLKFNDSYSEPEVSKDLNQHYQTHGTSGYGLIGLINVSDSNGNLLFYSGDSITMIYNRNFQPMKGFERLPTGVIFETVVKKPNSNQYYLGGEHWLSYEQKLFYKHICIDMSLDSGLGEIIVDSSSYFPPFTDYINHPSGRFVWLLNSIKSKRDSAVYLHAYKLTADGVDSNDVVVSTLTDKPYSIFVLNQVTPSCKVSHDGKYLVVSNVDFDSIYKLYFYKEQLFPDRRSIFLDFDIETGKATNPKQLRMPYSDSAGNNRINTTQYLSYFEFPKESNYLYLYVSSVWFGTKGELFQCPVSIDKDTFYTEICKKINGRNLLNYGYFSPPKLAPNGKVYLGRWDSSTSHDSSITVINEPDKNGDSCDLTRFPIEIENIDDKHGHHFPLPNKVLPSLYYPQIKSDGNCSNQSSSFWITYSEYDSIAWDFGDGIKVVSYKDTIEHQYSKSGEFVVFAKVFKYGEFDTTTFYKTIHSINPLKLGNDTLICNGNTFEIDAFNSNYTSYKWNNDSTNSFIEIDKEGLYSLEVENEFCSTKDSIFFGFVECSFSASNFCLGDTLEVSLQASALDSIVWNFGDGTVITNNEIKTQHLYQNKGDYTINASLYYKGLSLKMNSLNVNIHSIQKPFLPDDTSSCMPIVIGIQANSDYTYLWNNGDTIANILVKNSGLYFLTINYGDCQATDSIDVEIILVTKPELPSDTSICEPFLFAPKNIDKDYTYFWNTGWKEPELMVNESGLYIVNAYFKDCFNSDSIEVEKLICDCDVYIPDAFSPNNNDNLNDVFYFVAACPLEVNYFRILDRWGNLLFDSKENTGWDGTYMNKKVPTGVYAYMISVTSLNGKSYVFNGLVTLVR